MVGTRAIRGDTVGGSRCWGKERGREGRATLSPDSGALLKGVRGVFFTEPLPKPTCLGGGSSALCPRSQGSRSCPLVLSCGAAQPLRPPASDRKDPGGSGQARRTIPDSTELGVCYQSACGAASPSVTRRSCASVRRTRRKRTANGAGPSSSSTAAVKKVQK